MPHGHHNHTVPHEASHADEWHHHSRGEKPQAEHGAHISYASIIFWSSALVIATVASIGAVWIYFDHYIEKVKVERFEFNLYSLDQGEGDAFKMMQERESRTYKAGVLDGTLKQTGWVEGQNDVVQIPLSLAKEKVMKKYSQVPNQIPNQSPK